MPLDLQVNLLRVLQEGYITRIGGNKNIPIDVRVIAATKKNLFDEVKKGTFREDLFYRLSVIPILIPPLRERGNDRVRLFNHFLKVKAHKLDKPIPTISQDIFNKVVEYNWPGNVRELENFVENIVNFNGKSSFNITNQRTNNKIYQEQVSNNIEGQTSLIIDENEFNMTLEEKEKQTIHTYLEHFDRNITKISSKLGISRTTLYTKMKKYNIS